MVENVKFPGKTVISDGNDVISRLAYKVNGGIAIYTITPSSPFGEEASRRHAAHEKNIYGVVPQVFMACDEAAAAAFIQGIAAKGVGSATASSSQGILLMIPEMYNVAGQLLPVSFYIGARDITRHSLTIFGGHSDVYAVRDTGIIILFARNAQELQDLGAIAERLKWEVSLPVCVAYDGFLTSHRQTKLLELSDEFLWEFMPHEKMLAHKERSLDPTHPTVWGTNENPDGYMQGCLAQKPHTLAVGEVLPKLMEEFAELTGREYSSYVYHGHPEATDVVVAMGSSTSTLRATIDHMCEADPDRRIGMVEVRVFRPFLTGEFIKALPTSVERIAVLDRTMNHTAQDEPLCGDVRTAVTQAYQGFDGLPKLDRLPLVTGGVYGLAGKDFHPGSVIEVFNHLSEMQKTGRFWTGFTVGVVDDVMHTSLPMVDAPNIFPADEVRQARIVAFGSDGTVSMVKTAAKTYAGQPIPDNPNSTFHIASHAEYDSKKAGGVTVSHFRVSTQPLEECFSVRTPDYVAIHHPAVLEKCVGLLDGILKGGTLVLNTAQDPESIFASLPADMQAEIIEQEISCYAIDAFKIALDEGLGNKISMIMQRVLFDRFGFITKEDADRTMEASIEKAFSKKGPEVVERNVRAFRRAVEALAVVPVPTAVTAAKTDRAVEYVIDHAKELSFEGLDVPVPTEVGFREGIQQSGLSGIGDEVPVSAYFANARGGARPVNTWKNLDRGFATQLPVFHPHACTECGACIYACPTGGALELSQLDGEKKREFADKPLARVYRNSFDYAVKSTDGAGMFGGLQVIEDRAYGLAVDPNLCTGCKVCEENCNHGAITLMPATPERRDWLQERRDILDVCDAGGAGVDTNLEVSGKRLTQSEMEMLPNYVGTSGACAGCYEPLFVAKFLQLYPHTVISNATGCSSIWGAQAYETPYGTDAQGCGPAWMNPLFENNAAVGGGMALGVAQERDQMFASFDVVSEAIRHRTDLADQEPIGRLREMMAEMQSRQSGEIKTLGDRIDSVEFVHKIQTVIGEVVDLPVVQQDRVLATHVGLLKATVSNHLDKTTLIVGGDGWAFDIGLQMLMHVLQSELNLVVMVLVTDVYSNTGGQKSKATPKGMDAPFAPGGKDQLRFPLGISVAYGKNAYVAQVNMDYPNQMQAAFHRAVKYDGPALLLCYVPCMTAQKFPADQVPNQSKRATTTRYWPLWSYDPEVDAWSVEGNPDSHRLVAKKEGSFVNDFARYENRFRSQFRDGEASGLLKSQEEENLRIWSLLQKNAGVKVRG